jgi:hypothetical protein
MPGNRPLALFSLLITLAFAACGGGDDDDTGDARQPDDGLLTAAEYRTQANALCVEGAAEIEAIPASESEADYVDYIEEVFDTGHRYTAQFTSLEPPPELRSLHQRAVRIAEDEREATEAVVTRLRRSPDPVAQSELEFSVVRLIALRARQVRRELGLDKCTELEDSSGSSSASP